MVSIGTFPTPLRAFWFAAALDWYSRSTASRHSLMESSLQRPSSRARCTSARNSSSQLRGAAIDSPTRIAAVRAPPVPPELDLARLGVPARDLPPPIPAPVTTDPALSSSRSLSHASVISA
eukprot:CAMPEP_0173349186 /NCGR_PEP_ID=MMETSP1144-20121109/14171_1 /TAXON_ID=483371 /ORGANISM="non described non described, Strain CCMP2298" /LENGTH=120 /DNA_ID=CAMNT_0014296959 /DNA_START=771 /DNA_END=1130 /DNA_ORIENTATION=+